MKEATGEANITVITIVLIAIVLAIGTVIVNSVLNNSKKSSACNSAGAFWVKGKCMQHKDGTGKQLQCAKATGNEKSVAVKAGEFYCILK